MRPKVDELEDILPEEPAKKQYFLEKGYSDLKAVIKDSFAMNSAEAKDQFKKRKSDSDYRIVKISNWVMRIFASLAIRLFGMVLTFAISTVHCLVVFIIMLFVYLGLGVAKLIDFIYIHFGRISVICDNCKTKSVLPGYKCPFCGQIHYRLRPNVYGIFTHKCLCGQKLPALFLCSTKNKDTGDVIKRKKLEAFCSNPDCSKVVFSEESRPLCIPIAGTTSVGKTSYLTAVSHELVEVRLKPAGCEIAQYSPEKENGFLELMSNYSRGEVEKTHESNEVEVPSATSISYFVKHKTLRPKRLVHMFDIAGETFLNNSEHEGQKHYRYSDGVILIIDPLSIPEVSSQFEDQLNDVDLKGIGKDDPNEAVSSLIGKMRLQAGLNEGQKIEVPLAVVINKIDEPGVRDYFTDEAKKRFVDPERKQDDYAAENLLCKAFFTENYMGNFVNLIEVNFKTVRYFACSAIGHTRGEGAYSPQRVLKPIEWITSLTDARLNKLVADAHQSLNKEANEEDEIKGEENKEESEAKNE